MITATSFVSQSLLALSPSACSSFWRGRTAHRKRAGYRLVGGVLLLRTLSDTAQYNADGQRFPEDTVFRFRGRLCSVRPVRTYPRRLARFCGKVVGVLAHLGNGRKLFCVSLFPRQSPVRPFNGGALPFARGACCVFPAETLCKGRKQRLGQRHEAVTGIQTHDGVLSPCKAMGSFLYRLSPRKRCLLEDMACAMALLLQRVHNRFGVHRLLSVFRRVVRFRKHLQTGL